MSEFVREDLELLQAQARLWLETFLHESLPSDSKLSASLADGAILAKVADKVQRLRQAAARGEKGTSTSDVLPDAGLLPRKDGAAKGWSRFANVDEFLQMCHEIGLRDMDLFTATDVIQEKDIKRVCFCLRALSKKARALHLEVPDFDDHRIHKRLQSTGIIENAKKDFLEYAALPKPSHETQVGKVALPDFVNESEIHANEASSVSRPLKDEIPSTRTDPSASNPKLTRPSPAEFSPMVSSQDERTLDAEVGNKEQSAEEEGRRPQNSSPFRWLSLGATTAICGVIAAVYLSRRRGRQHEVKRGDTLSRIARQTGQKSWKILHQKNPDIKDPNLIYPGQKLKLTH